MKFIVKRYWQTLLFLWVFMALAVILNHTVAASGSSAAFSGHSPGRDTIVTVASPRVTVYISAPADLNSVSAGAQLNGSPVPASFEAAMVWVPDEFGEPGDNMLVTDLRQGLITVHAPTLANGTYNIEVTIRDVGGNIFRETWTFTVAAAPVISGPLPAGSGRERTPLISANLTAGGAAVDPASIVLQLNGQTVSHHFDPAAGLVTHTPPQPLADGSYQVRLMVRDLAGTPAVRDWHFTVDTTPPALTGLLHFSDGMTLSDGRLRFAARVNDSSDIRDNATLSLNGVPLPVNISYPGRWVWINEYYGEGYWHITSRREANIEFGGPVPNGRHTLSLRTEDLLGHVRVDTWTFTVASAPVISGPRPTAYGIREFKPLISARVAGTGAALDPASIVLQLNGQTVSHHFDPATGLVSHTPLQALANESYHRVALTVRDLSGLQTQKSWTFYITTYPDMADSNIANCLPCHQLYPPQPQIPVFRSAGPFEDVHSRVLRFYGDHEQHQGSPPWDCNRCHNYIDAPAECWQCHGDYLGGYGYDFAPHGSRPDIRPRAINYDPHFPVRILQSREPWDCVICHQPGSGLALNHHDLPELHKGSPSSCDSCHARSLTREHAREGRLDANNRPITCLTCHQSTNPAVTAAIAARDKSCAACHPAVATGDAHAELHVVRYGSVCVECHSNNMMTEPVYHRNNCDSCHAGTSPQAQSAIQWQKRSCFDCHDQPHGIFMATIPEDLPLHPAVSWGQPQAASVWSAEGWLPDVFNNPAGRVIFSSRATLEAAAVYTFYKTEMESAGWTLQSESYKPGDRDFTLHYAKGRRHCTIWFYSGSQPGFTGQNPQGQRLQIAYH